MANPSLFRIILFTIKFLPRQFIGRIRGWIFYGINQKVIWIDLALWRQYPFFSPYRTCRKFIKDNDGDAKFIFGETPLTTLAKICKHAQIPEGMVIFDVGCGWGRSTFFLHSFTKAHRTIGIDIVQTYTQKAERIRQWMKLDYLVFVNADIRKVDYSDADVIYMYGTCFDNEFAAEMVDVWERQLLDGTIVITTSYSLEPYSKHARIHLQDIIIADYIWGACPVYFHIIGTARSD